MSVTLERPGSNVPAILEERAAVRAILAPNGADLEVLLINLHRQSAQSQRKARKSQRKLRAELATVYPELVTHTATGEVQAVRYQELIPMLVNEVQRQQQVVERQQHVTEHLQRELAELRSLVGQMRGGIAQR